MHVGQPFHLTAKQQVSLCHCSIVEVCGSAFWDRFPPYPCTVESLPYEPTLLYQQTGEVLLQVSSPGTFIPGDS